MRSHTPPKVGFFLAMALPSLARVLVGPMPTLEQPAARSLMLPGYCKLR
jgi:hypothetical protein